MKIYKVWRAMYPMALYVIIQSLVFTAGTIFVSRFFPEILAEAGQSVSAWSDLSVTFLTISAAVSTIIFGMLYQSDVRKRTWKPDKTLTGRDVWLIAAASIAFSVVGNNLVNISPLPELSDSYEETSAMLMSGSLMLQLLCVGILAPIVEELVMRGLLYERLREIMRPAWAIFFGGILFGVFHGNLVQGVYAACFGWFLCWLMETYHSLKATVLSHMVSNLAVSLVVSSTFYEKLCYNDISFAIVTAAAGAVFLWAVLQLRADRSKEEVSE